MSTWQPLPPSPSAERDALLTRVAQRVLALGEGRPRAGVDGLTTAGKTSFGHEFTVRICRAGRPVLCTSMDDFNKPWRDRHLHDREPAGG